MGKFICMVPFILDQKEAQSYPKDYEHEGLGRHQTT